MESTQESDRIVSLPDGHTALVGSTQSYANAMFPWLLKVESSEIGIDRNPVFERVEGEGRLW